MTQDELMIGDWVQDEKNNVVKIDTHWTLYNAEFFEPIPITVDILEANGFLRWKNSSLYQYEWKDIHIGYDFNVQGLGIYKFRECDFEFKKNFEYVHELQHALRLCKIEKEIVI